MNETRKEELSHLGILAICQRLKMHVEHTSDPLSDRDYYDYRAFLHFKSNTWTERTHSSRAYDSAVYNLLFATLIMTQE